MGSSYWIGHAGFSATFEADSTGSPEEADFSSCRRFSFSLGIELRVIGCRVNAFQGSEWREKGGRNFDKSERFL